MNDEKYWGYHLILDMGDCNEFINDVDVVRQFITELVDKLHMYALGAPIVIYVDTPEGKGVSAVQIITTSTITFHGDDNGKQVFLDVFSCKEYEATTVLTHVKTYFAPKRIRHRLLYRHAS